MFSLGKVTEVLTGKVTEVLTGKVTEVLTGKVTEVLTGKVTEGVNLFVRTCVRGWLTPCHQTGKAMGGLHFFEKA